MFELSSFKNAFSKIDREKIDEREKIFRKRVILNSVEEMSILLKSEKLKKFFDDKSAELRDQETAINARESGVRWP